MSTAPARPRPQTAWLLPILLLLLAYGLLGLTLTEQISHAEIMRRCVLVSPGLSRIWSVSNVEVGLSYLGVFGGMLYYFLGLYRRSSVHLNDLTLALAYLFGSFVLDYVCVRLFAPFPAMLIGDAAVMTFTLVVSRQLWFQRLLGVFVPLVFLTCGIGHFLEGVSYWYLTYPANVPWTMVTADVAFAVLVNSSRFPAFIRGEDVVEALAEERKRADALAAEVEARTAVQAALRESHARQRRTLREMLAALTEGRLRVCDGPGELPAPLADAAEPVVLTRASLRALRLETAAAAARAGLPADRSEELVNAVGEAAMNAVVHAGGGVGVVRARPDAGTVQVWVTDRGAGIPEETLHRAVLERGYTTAGTLGHGFWLMLQTADRVFLHTGPAGTTVVAEKDRTPPAPAWLLGP